jgi:uncharacterized SAM-binding protein YcdF (DUF218 family)
MMEIALTYIVNAFILPPGGLIVLLVIALWLLKRRPAMARKLLITTTGLLFLLSLPLVSSNLMRGLESYPVLTEIQIKAFQPQAIVILAGGRRNHAPEFGGFSPSHATLQRMLYGVRLQRETGLPMLVTGGNEEEDRPAEAKVMQETLVNEFTAPARWVEDRSRNTAENAQFTAAILEREGIKRIILVTQAWHLKRAMLSFEQQGLHVLAAPTVFEGTADGRDIGDYLPSATALLESYYALHEFIGIGWYKIRY